MLGGLTRALMIERDLRVDGIVCGGSLLHVLGCGGFVL